MLQNTFPIFDILVESVDARPMLATICNQEDLLLDHAIKHSRYLTFALSMQG
jgi:hypothetical protein